MSYGKGTLDLNNMQKRPYSLSASIICANPLNLESEIAKLKNARIDYIHFDVMDGLFVPRLGLFPEMLASITGASKIPVDVHLMIQNPDNYVDLFAAAGAKIISVHPEACLHLHRTIQHIKSCGVLASVALNPATSLNSLEYVLDDLTMVLIMGINPGIVGHKLIPQTYNKISQLKNMVKSRPNFLIQVDGGVTFDSGPKMINAGANVLVCGSSTIFKDGINVNKSIVKFRRILDGEI